jgi:hypothetical protein
MLLMVDAVAKADFTRSSSLNIKPSPRICCVALSRIRYRSPVDRRSRAQRWHAAAAELIALQDDYRTWLNALPQNLEASATAEGLRAICDLDLSYIERVEPRRGFGRD